VRKLHRALVGAGRTPATAVAYYSMMKPRIMIALCAPVVSPRRSAHLLLLAR
jgi:hypothetical protein